MNTWHEPGVPPAHLQESHLPSRTPMRSMGAAPASTRCVTRCFLLHWASFGKLSGMRCSLDLPHKRLPFFCYMYAPVLVLNYPLSTAVCSHRHSRACSLQHPDHVTTTFGWKSQRLEHTAAFLHVCRIVYTQLQTLASAQFSLALQLSCIKIHACLTAHAV